MKMRRELSFEKFGKVIIVLGVLFYAGFINPVAQAWCDALCPHTTSSEQQQSSGLNGCPENAEDSQGKFDLRCHAPDFADTHSMSHFNIDWTPMVVPAAELITHSRFEMSALQLLTEEPDISLDSPPPKSILV